MKIFHSILVVVALSLAIPSVIAEAKKERTIRGVLACAKCTLKKAKSCQAALTVQRKNKQGEQIARIIFLKSNENAKAFHDNISPGDQSACQSHRRHRRQTKKPNARCRQNRESKGLQKESTQAKFLKRENLFLSITKQPARKCSSGFFPPQFPDGLTHRHRSLNPFPLWQF